MFRSSVFKRIAAMRTARRACRDAQINKKPAHASASAGLVCGTNSYRLGPTWRCSPAFALAVSGCPASAS
ncbi:hypothetical protein [Burkholderia humptydooensis]|uniref:hypothetical protein n=1 Tax=Burkholderia humptydooensis TaxID=430531 RepID=UPI000A434F0B|nr:hypothetical protein [Burkholderia humptydooensis]